MNNLAFQFSSEAWKQTKNLQFYSNPDTVFFTSCFWLFLMVAVWGDVLFNNFCLLTRASWLMATERLWLAWNSFAQWVQYKGIPCSKNEWWSFFSFQFWIWKQSFKYELLRPWVQPLYRRKENLRLDFSKHMRKLKHRNGTKEKWSSLIAVEILWFE